MRLKSCEIWHCVVWQIVPKIWWSESATISQNIRNHFPNDIVLYPIRLLSSETLRWTLKTHPDMFCRSLLLSMTFCFIWVIKYVFIPWSSFPDTQYWKIAEQLLIFKLNMWYIYIYYCNVLCFREMLSSYIVFWSRFWRQRVSPKCW